MKRLIPTAMAMMLVLTACVDEDDAPPPDDDGQAAEDDGEAPTTPDTGDSLLDTVQSRGELRCGVNNVVPGFGSVDADGNFEGFDIDFCKAVAAGVLGDPEAVEYLPLTAGERFTALQSGEIDVLIRNTTWTATRDGSEGSTFIYTTFYDGQGMMVSADSDFTSLDDLGGGDICVLQGTTTERNLAAESEFRGLNLNPLPFDDNDALQAAFEAGQCDAWTADRSALFGLREAFPAGPDSVVVLDDVISKEPLGPYVLGGDKRWADAVRWIVMSTVIAEEFGITQDNVDGFDTSHPSVARFLGAPDPEEGTVFDPALGLPTDFAATVIAAVGNYGEIFERHLTPRGLERNENSLWTDGGLLYAPPFV